MTLQNQVARQIKQVLRLKPGDTIMVLDNSGLAWQVELTQLADRVVQGQIISQQQAGGEPGVEITLYQGTLKAQKFEWVLQKGAELGICRFVPIICGRSITNNMAALAKKHSRWQRIILEAAEQSQRGKLPDLEQAVSFSEALDQLNPASLSLMPWEAAPTTPTLKTILQESELNRPIAIFIGPEGGFSPAEADLARDRGVYLVKLGPRILRAETAGLALCSALLYEMNEWG